MAFAFLGRQPILDKDKNIVFYSLLMRRSNSRKIALKDMMEGDASAISELIHSFDLEKTLNGKPAFIKVDDQVLIKTDFSILSPEHIVFELYDQAKFSTKASVEIEKLMDLGFKFAISHLLIDDVLLKRDEAFLARFSYVVCNVRKLDFEIFHKHERLFKRLNMSLIATKVETQQGFEMCKRLGFHYFLGYFFEEPQLLKDKKISAQKVVLLNLLGKLRVDTDIAEIVKIIQYAPDISMLLMKFINSANYSAKKEVETILQAVNLLGREQLTSWVSLALFSATEGKTDLSLIESSLMRAKTMEQLCHLLKRPEYVNQAYLVGLLSLADALFKIPMREIIDKGYFSQAVTAALLDGGGELGKILKLAIVLEHGNYKKIEFISQKLKVPIEQLSKMLNDSYRYVIEVKKFMS